MALFNRLNDIEDEGHAYRKYMDVQGIISATEASKEMEKLTDLEVEVICAHEHLLDMWENCAPVDQIKAEVAKIQGRAHV